MEKTNISVILGDKKVFIFYVSLGNLDDKDVDKYLDLFKSENPLEKYEDVVCLYIPSRDDNHRVIKL